MVRMLDPAVRFPQNGITQKVEWAQKNRSFISASANFGELKHLEGGLQ
jgi:hypothetical protein